MHAEVSVRLRPGGRWLPAVLTTERAESSYGLPVVVVQGESNARGAAEVECVRVSHDVPANLVDAAVDQGYFVLGVPGPAVPDPAVDGGEEDLELDPDRLELTDDRPRPDPRARPGAGDHFLRNDREV